MTIATDSHVRFEGIADGSDLLGATQANFAVQRKGQNTKETSILLNDRAATYLAGVLGTEDTIAFRESAARHLGQLWVETLVERGRHLDSIYFLAKSSLEAEPAIVAHLKELVQHATAMHAAHDAATHAELAHA